FAVSFTENCLVVTRRRRQINLRRAELGNKAIQPGGIDLPLAQSRRRGQKQEADDAEARTQPLEFTPCVDHNFLIYHRMCLTQIEMFRFIVFCFSLLKRFWRRVLLPAWYAH